MRLKLSLANALENIYRIRPKIECFCHVWAGASKFSISSLDSPKTFTQPSGWWIIFQKPFSHRRTISSLSKHYRYFHGKCFEELHSFVTSILTSTSRTQLRIHSSLPFYSTGEMFHPIASFRDPILCGITSQYFVTLPSKHRQLYQDINRKWLNQTT